MHTPPSRDALGSDDKIFSDPLQHFSHLKPRMLDLGMLVQVSCLSKENLPFLLDKKYEHISTFQLSLALIYCNFFAIVFLDPHNP